MMYKKQFNVNLSDDIVTNGNIIIKGNDDIINFNVISSIINQLLKNDSTIEYITNNTITSDFVNVVNMHNSKELLEVLAQYDKLMTNRLKSLSNMGDIITHKRVKFSESIILIIDNLDSLIKDMTSDTISEIMNIITRFARLSPSIGIMTIISFNGNVFSNGILYKQGLISIFNNTENIIVTSNIDSNTSKYFLRDAIDLTLPKNFGLLYTHGDSYSLFNLKNIDLTLI